MTISSNENGTGLQYDRDAHSDLERAIDALNRGDHASALKLCETVISQTIEGDPARTEAELRYVEAVIMRGHIYSAFDLFVMGDLYYLTPEVRAEIKPHYDVYRRCSQNPKSITEIIDGLGRSFDVGEVYSRMLEKQNRHRLMTAASDVKYLRGLMDKGYSPDKDFQITALGMYLYLVTNIHKPEVRGLVLDNFDDLVTVIPRALRTCLKEKEYGGKVYTMTDLMSTLSRYAKAVRFLDEEDYAIDRVDESFISEFKMTMNSRADRRDLSPNVRSEFMKNRDNAVELMREIMRLQTECPDTLTEANRAKVWDYHGDTMD